MGYVCGHRQQPSDQPHMGTAFNTRQDFSGLVGCFQSDVDAFVDAVLAELAAMAADGTRPTRSGPKPPLTGAALRKAIMAIWCVCVLRHAVARDWPALRHSVRHAVHAVRPLDPAVAPPAQPLDPGLAAGLRRYCRPQRRHHRQPLLSVGADLLRRAASTAARRSRASKSISRSINTASRWRSPSRRRISMTARASSRCCINLPASRGPPWAISAIAASGCKPARRSASPSNPAPAVTAEPSFRRVFAGSSSAPWPGSAATAG